MNITVIGCGRWGSLITWYLDHIGHHVTLYGRQSSPRMQSFLATRQNDLLTLPESVALSTDLAAALEVCGIPAAVRGETLDIPTFAALSNELFRRIPHV